MGNVEYSLWTEPPQSSLFHIASSSSFSLWLSWSVFVYPTLTRPNICVASCFRYLSIFFGIQYSLSSCLSPVHRPRSSHVAQGFCFLIFHLSSRLILWVCVAIAVTIWVWDPIPSWLGHAIASSRSSPPRSLGFGR